MRPRYRSFGSFVRETFGSSVQKVNIDAGFTCPNRDGTLGLSGCIYCNNESFTPGPCRPTLSVREQVRNGIAYVSRRYGATRYIAYFQAYTNTYAPVETLERVYREALENPAVVGLAIGTRPDCVDDEKLDLLARIARTHFVLIEYGLQSPYEKSLAFIRRGHGFAEFTRAVEMTRARGLAVGAHTIVGLPTETRDEMLGIADAVTESGVGFVKVHQLQVIAGTPLAELFARAPFAVFTYEEYLDFIVEFIERLGEEIVVQRLFATAPDAVLLAPIWGRSRHETLRDIEQRLRLRKTRQGARVRTRPRSHAARG
jgi:hypothetical protein